jgi:RNA recognition motif-containing protein
VLHQAFVPFGEVIEVNIPSDDRASENHRGFGYVEFESQEDALAAIDNMDQAMLAGRILTVAPAKPQKDVGNILGSKVAVWEQVDYPLGRRIAGRNVTDNAYRRIGSGNMKSQKKIELRQNRPRRRLWRRQLIRCRVLKDWMSRDRNLHPNRRDAFHNYLLGYGPKPFGKQISHTTAIDW